MARDTKHTILLGTTADNVAKCYSYRGFFTHESLCKSAIKRGLVGTIHVTYSHYWPKEMRFIEHAKVTLELVPEPPPITYATRYK